MTREEILEKIYDSYCTWYDMQKCGDEKTPLFAQGEFHESASSYMLIERATMWTANSNDYLYIFSLPELTAANVTEFISIAKADGETRIHPDKNHKCSYITALFICDHADEAARSELTKYRFRKDFTFGFRGWEEVHTALMTADDGSISSNKDGLHTAKFLTDVFYPKKKGFIHKIKGV